MKKLIIVLTIVLSLVLADSIYALTINNRDARPHDIQIYGIRDGRRSFVKVYQNSTVRVGCMYGCQITVIDTGDTKTLGPENTRPGRPTSDKSLVIQGGRLK
jgi:hypothetical protein